MTQSSYGNGAVSELDYRSDNLLRRVRTPQVRLIVGGNTYTCSTQYDDASREIQLVYPDGSLVDRDFTDRNQLAEVRYKGQVVNTRLYDDGLRLERSTLGNDVSTRFLYRADNLVSTIRTPRVDGASGGAGNYTYQYDANKNKTSETITGKLADFGFGSSGATAYDDQDRLTAWNRNDGNLNQQWDLSLVGDFTGITENGLLTGRNYNAAHEVTNIGTDVLVHDAKGNLTQTDDGRELTWDFDNRLSRAVVPAGSQRGIGGTHTYTYDANGRRVSKVTGGLQTVFVCAGPRVISEYTTAIGTTANVASPTQSYVHGSYIDELILKENAAGILYYNRNQQYSIVSLTDSSGSVVERYSYDAYGKTAIRRLNGNERPQSGFDNDYTYTGRRSDPESGLIYFRARYYDAQIAQFISRDPLGYVDGMSLYRGYFVPNGMDPWGMFIVPEGDERAWWNPGNWPGFLTEALFGNEEERRAMMFGHNREDQNRAADDLALNKDKISDHCEFITNSKRGTPLADECIRQLAETGVNHLAGGGMAASPLTLLGKRRLAKNLCGVPRSAQPVEQGGYGKGTKWWEYVDGQGNKKIVVEHADGSVHCGRPKLQSCHRDGSGPPKYYPEPGTGHVGDD